MKFQEFLEEKFDEQFAEDYGYDDPVDAYDHWIENIDIDLLINYADQFAIDCRLKTIDEMMDKLTGK